MALFLGLGCLMFLWGAQPFLAVSRPVDADVMVIEGWLPSYALHSPVNELKTGRYERVFVSGLIFEKGDANYHYVSDSARVAEDLVELGVSSSLIEPCPIPTPWFNRTAHMARGVRDRIQALGLKPRGIKVVTLGSHARQSLLAYDRMMEAIAPVGIEVIPDTTYDPERWWASLRGIQKTTKNFAGWLKETAVGLRS